MKLVYIVGGVVAVLAWLAIGLFVAKGPQPEIIVPAEVIFKLGPLNVSNTLLTSWVVMAFIIILSLLATRSMKIIPGGLQNFVEAAIAFLVTQVEEIAGEKNGRRFFMLVATIFLYVIINNWAGLLPFFNAVGKTEDVGNHLFHELSSPEPKDLEIGPDGKVIANKKFAAWKMEETGGMVVAKSGTSAIDFKVRAGETQGEAFDRYVVFLAHHFADFDASEEDIEHPTADMVKQAAAKLNGEHAPELLSETAAAQGHGEGEHHAVHSPALGKDISGISFENSQKMALVVPFFRGTFSDINNTLALGIIAFLAIEFWGFQALGPGYLKKFFNLNGIMSFVGILELLSEFIRIISFAFRLFGNIFAGEVLVLMLTFLMPFLFVDIIYMLELFVGFIQASVFALLTLVFATMAVEHHSDEEHHESHHDEDAAADAHHHPGAAPAH